MEKPETPTLTPLQKAAASRKLVEAEIISRAWTDEDFRGKLAANPAAALAEAGIPVPAGKTIRIVEEEPGVLTLILPAAPALSEEASDDELAAVAGGGLIDHGKCQAWDLSEKERAKGNGGWSAFFKTVTVITGAVGVSWGYG